MRAIVLTALAALAVAGPLAAAQLYRWVDEKGNVEWRDTPPPSNAKNVERRTLKSNTIETSNLPYSVQQAVKNNPVTLWTYDCGEPCNDARNHLTRRGIPYTERNSQKDPEGMKKATGGLQAPVLIVGSSQYKGYLDTQWDSALDLAGYPKTPIPGVKMKPPVEPGGKATAESKGVAPAGPK